MRAILDTFFRKIKESLAVNFKKIISFYNFPTSRLSYDFPIVSILILSGLLLSRISFFSIETVYVKRTIGFSVNKAPSPFPRISKRILSNTFAKDLAHARSAKDNFSVEEARLYPFENYRPLFTASTSS